MTRLSDPEERDIEVLRRLVTIEDRDVLDIGCGDGRTTHRIARTAASVLGIDPDEERIAEALGTPAERCTFRVADIVGLDLPPAGYDVVVFSRSL